jgi:hypothetical protein
MNPTHEARLREIPGLLKSLVSEAVDLLEKDEYNANTSQWRNDLLASIAHLERVISEQLDGSPKFSPGREIRRGTDHWD